MSCSNYCLQEFETDQSDKTWHVKYLTNDCMNNYAEFHSDLHKDKLHTETDQQWPLYVNIPSLTTNGTVIPLQRSTTSWSSENQP